MHECKPVREWERHLYLKVRNFSPSVQKHVLNSYINRTSYIETIHAAREPHVVHASLIYHAEQVEEGDLSSRHFVPQSHVPLTWVLLHVGLKIELFGLLDEPKPRVVIKSLHDSPEISVVPLHSMEETIRINQFAPKALNLLRTLQVNISADSYTRI